MRVLAVVLIALSSVAAVASLPLPDLAHVEEWEIPVIANTVGHNASQRELITRRLGGWKAMLASPDNLALDDAAKLKLVNDYVNQTPFVCDAAQWCVEDYWATPIEFLANNGGDCEDFAIAKYYALRALNVADGKLRLIYAKIRRGNLSGSHVVLAYYPAPDAEPWLLDNLDQRVLPASQRADLTPLLSLDARHVRAERQTLMPVSEVARKRWGDAWQGVQNDRNIRFLTPAQREAPQCQRLRARAAWCT